MALQSRRQIASGVFRKDYFYRDVRVLSVHIDYPFASMTHSSAGFRRMARFYSRVFGSFQKYCTTRLLQEAKKRLDSSADGEFESYFAALTYKVTYQSDSLVSLYYDRTEFRGSRERTLLRYADTWALPGGRLRELRDFVGGGRHWKKEVVKRVRENVELARAGAEPLYSDCAKRAAQTFSSRRFYLKNEGTVVFYQPLTLSGDPDCVYEILL